MKQDRLGVGGKGREVDVVRARCYRAGTFELVLAVASLFFTLGCVILQGAMLICFGSMVWVDLRIVF